MLSLAAGFANDWQLQFNHNKYNVLIVCQRVNSTKLWKLIGNKQISEVDSYKYLGVHISRNLHDHSHVQEVIKKGNRLISYIKSIRLIILTRLTMHALYGLPVANFLSVKCVSSTIICIRLQHIHYGINM